MQILLFYIVTLRINPGQNNPGGNNNLFYLIEPFHCNQSVTALTYLSNVQRISAIFFNWIQSIWLLSQIIAYAWPGWPQSLTCSEVKHWLLSIAPGWMTTTRVFSDILVPLPIVKNTLKITFRQSNGERYKASTT